jgi:hypothetical protein
MICFQASWRVQHVRQATAGACMIAVRNEDADMVMVEGLD